MAKGRTTIHDIARELGVTASTVSRALNGHPSISDTTRRAVEEMAGKLNYKPNHIAAALRSGRSYIIGVVVPAADRSFFAKVIRGIEEEVEPAGYSVLLGQTYEDFDKERKVLDTLMRTRVDGIIASIAKGTARYEHYRKLREEGIPLVLFDNTIETLSASTVTINDYQGAYMAVRHLIRQGCRRIAHFFGHQNLNIYRERLRGYRTALEEHGLGFDEDLVRLCPSDLEQGRQQGRILLELSRPPDALFSSSDYAALGAMQVFKQQGLIVPDDIAIVGFANEPFTSFTEPALSSVDQHSARMGQHAARALLDEITDTEHHRPRQTVLQPELIVRASSLRRRDVAEVGGAFPSAS